MKGKAILTFDTSALNRLADDGDLDLCVAAIQSGYEVRLPELATGEIYATRIFSRRNDLYEICRKLLSDGYCISPPHWLISILVKRHNQAPTTFDWSAVPWRCHADEEHIRTGTILSNEELAARQLENQEKVKKDFETGFKQGIGLAKWGESIKQEEHNGGLLAVARNLYERALSYDQGTGGVPVAPNVELGRGELGGFVDSCPPFKALVYAYAMTAYDRSCAQTPSGGPKYRAGRNDQFMSVYLPYCDKFITAEKNRVQERCLREIARLANVATEVLSYDDLRLRLLATASSAPGAA